MPMSYTITKLNSENLQLSEALINGWYADEGVTNHPMPSPAWRRSVLERPGVHSFVAQLGEEVVGGATGYELPLLDQENVTELFLYEIGVASAHRKKGVARLLMEAFKQHCRERGITTMYLGTELDNEAARSLYRNTQAKEEEIVWYTYTVSAADTPAKRDQ